VCPQPELARFVEAQTPVWPRVVAELTTGAKASHWIWFVFPQIAGLGRSAMSQAFALDGCAAARAYLSHPVLGQRLREATRLMLAHRGTPAAAILGSLDAAKFRSSMTLFATAAPDEPIFADALAAFFEGPDPQTLARLSP
jgi:uncharacterized protein (DUF1810 family)